MSKPIISVIIPVYNAEAYIEKCIVSVLNQTFEEIEIIAVNDGSTDNSLQVLSKLAAADARLQVHHQQNKGVSATRNFALQKVTGTYIAFADADDWMEPNMLQQMHQSMIHNKADWAICNINIVENNAIVNVRLLLEDEQIDLTVNRVETLHRLMRFKFDNANWNKLYHAAIIQKQKITFDEGMTIWEDLLFNLMYLQFAKKVTVLAAPLYNYRIHSLGLFTGWQDNLIPQFNLLYKGYVQFAAKQQTMAEPEAFKKEMARITYNQLLYKIEVKAKENKAGFFAVLKNYRSYIGSFNPELFQYKGAELIGLQGVKKRILNGNQFFLFSFIIAIKKYFKKPVVFIRKLIK